MSRSRSDHNADGRARTAAASGAEFERAEQLRNQYEVSRGRSLPHASVAPVIAASSAVPARQVPPVPTFQPPPGLSGQRLSMPASMFMELSNTLQAINSNLDKKTLLGNHTDTKKTYEVLPKDVRAELKKLEGNLFDLYEKKAIAEKAIDKVKDGKKHPMAETVLSKQWQVSKEEISAHAAGRAMYDVKTLWQNMMKRHANDINEFAKQIADQQKSIYIWETNLDVFVERAKAIVNKHIDGNRDIYVQPSQKEALRVAVTFWASNAHAGIATKAAYKRRRQEEKREKYKKQLAEANAKFDALSSEEMLTYALLEARGFTVEKLPDEPKDGAVTAQQKSKYKVNSSDVLGAMLKKFPNIQKRYNIELLDELPGKKTSQKTPSRPTSNRSARSRQSSQRTARTSSIATSISTRRGRSQSQRSNKSSKSNKSNKSNRSHRATGTKPSTKTKTKSRSASARGSQKNVPQQKQKNGSRSASRASQKTQNRWNRNKSVFREASARRRQG
eukprot:TRINITY_DN60020_c0_g2_i1.p1 TRINITY_DN60020_c0_g2~~TRINITY_DN60020_c0_g2_i1.p1  ORF type:complete len:503 (+),score=100.27 TRINITY_DN60020_c0_g2_i1:539-2047(+)